MTETDVEALYHKGRWRLKALTPKAKHAFLTILEVPASAMLDEADAFIYGTDEQYDGIMADLRPYGLQITGGKPAWEI